MSAAGPTSPPDWQDIALGALATCQKWQGTCVAWERTTNGWRKEAERAAAAERTLTVVVAALFLACWVLILALIGVAT